MSADDSDRWAWPEGVARHVLAEVDSTNSEAARIGPSLTRPAWILAHRQTAGRGRRGRAWVDPVGNFAATLVMRPAGGPSQAALRSFVAALALEEALSALLGPAARLALKWPNDVLLNGGKVSGILIEGIAGGEKIAIGIGVNLAHAPDPADRDPRAPRPVSVAGETGIAVTPEELLDRLAPAFARWEAQLLAYGFSPLREAFLARVTRLGQPIVARTMSETIEGTFETIDADGSIVLMTAEGRRALPAADLFF
ncbi:biotin--[acetyl-CoA-carboxylase] ligase [Frigidibacter sp. MR17.14]|uniref:biotin--[acetyl-CoA-carboxylase] ligase n=1 Tax=Frigidibacter sp. MR17.14 TaxID=3126509 RepID=UPI003012F442